MLLWLPLLLLSTWTVDAKDNVPKIESKRFDSLPFNVQYFDDSDVILAQEENGKLWRSDDGGLGWHKADDVDQGDIASFWMNPFHNDQAYALGIKGKHWYTNNKGKSWHGFKLPGDSEPSQFRWPFAFHAFDADKVIFRAQECSSSGCQEIAYYTKNGFKDLDELRKDTRECIWAVGAPQSESLHSDKEDDSRILCIVAGDRYGTPEENKVVVTDNYFKDFKEPVMINGRRAKGFVNIANVKGYLIVAAKAEGSTELSLLISRDGDYWHHGTFPAEHKINEEAYTVMESTNYSVQVDVVTSKPWGSLGTLFSSDSNGTYFTENIRHTNRNAHGIVDFEKVQGIQGIVMVNVVENWEDIEKNPRGVEKKLQSKISFDDGRTWNYLKDSNGKKLHLHSVTDMSNSGKIFSSPAPGLVMGVGNTGDSLAGYSQGDLYVSDDAGLTWSKALDEAHKYEFGDQGTILVAVYDEGQTEEIRYSLNHGKDWEKVKLDKKVKANFLTTVPDSTTQKFILQAIGRDGSDIAYYIYTIDFNGIYADKCKDSDFEDWHARLDADGKPDCLMGHTQTYRRRKKDAKCYVGEKFKEAVPITKDCACTHEDFECTTDYIPDGQGKDMKCKPASPLKSPKDACKDGKGTFKSESGFRLIPGNTCKDGIKKDKEEIDRPCDDAKTPATPDGKIKASMTTFPGHNFAQKIYLERADGAQGDDETLVMSVAKPSGPIAGIYASRDHGKNWEPVFDKEDNYQYIIKHQYQNDRVFFVAPNSKKVVYSINRMETLETFDVQALMNERGVGPLTFHPDQPEYFVWTGDVDCERGNSDSCHLVSYLTKDRGGQWSTLARYSRKCEFIERKGRGQTKDLIYCEQHEGEKHNGKLQLRASEDLGGNFVTKSDDILAFATMAEYIIVAEKDPESNLRLSTSIDGQTFAHAKFPPGFDVPIQMAYTVLDSSTHAVFLHVTTSNVPSFEYGTIVKSNSNGTFYVTSLDYVNRNSEGYVDFEKMQGVDGVVMVNVIANPDDINSGKAKKLRSLISHNDGAQWAPMPAPKNNPEGDAWECDVSNPEKCSLHVHSYTERDDAKDTFSSSSAIGLMMAVGNVGEYLGDINDKDNTYTFVSGDAGITWNVVKKGRFMWEYGDQGSLIVIIERSSTNIGYYSTDGGKTWARFEFAKEKLSILDLTTVPSDNSKQFLIWFRNGENEVGTINLDFSSTRTDQICKIDEEHHGENDDYWLWTPKHPSQDTDCLFGKKTQYLRKRPDKDCWNGPKLERSHGEPIPCECRRQDFECDYNYVRTVDDRCELVTGLQPIEHAAVCKENPDRQTYWEGKGYRRVPISGCVGGEISKFLGEEHRCPGHENDVIDIPSERKGLSGFSFFLVAIVLPIAAAAGIGYLIWSRIQSGAGFGRIRLGETGSSSAFDADQPWIKWPVAAVSALIAVVAALPMVLGAGYRAITGLFGSGRRYTSRQSFARGRGDYSIVDDEDELLGDDEEDA